MAKPVLVVVDGEGASLQALTAELESRYGAIYQVVSGSSRRWRWPSWRSCRPRGLMCRWCLQRAPFLLETTTPGVFSAGDVRHGSIKRVASAVGDGSIAIRLIHDYLALTPSVRAQTGSPPSGRVGLRPAARVRRAFALAS